MKRGILLATIGIIAAGIILFALSFNTDAANDGVIAFGARPAFAAVPTAGLSDVGVSAYLDTGQTIDLDDLTGTFEIVEDQTADYIIGTVSLPDYGDDQGETFHVHAYASTDGWLLVYFMDDTPASKIIDWKAYINSSGSSITTLLELGMIKVAGDAGVAYEQPIYYDFRYPNATHMMFIGDLTGIDVYDQFRIELPSSNTYYETSWGIHKTWWYSGYWKIDGTTVAGSNPCQDCSAWGIVTVSPNTEHLIELNYTGGLAVIYKEG
jgi:hypothetical protein